MLLSVIVPAFNEELYLPRSLSSLQRAAADCECGVELIVVDNASTDRTAETARVSGARVVCEPVRNVARVRNAGAAAAHGEVLVFVDADTIVPHEFLDRVREVMIDPLCLGGSAEIVHHVRSQVLRAYLGAWRWIGFRLGSSHLGISKSEISMGGMVRHPAAIAHGHCSALLHAVEHTPKLCNPLR